MSRKYQWYLCNLVLTVSFLAACAVPAARGEGTATTPIPTEVVIPSKVAPTLVPRSGDLIFVEFFAIT